jgi:antitoxin component of MazEF toxin-antitoxin module
MSVRLCQWGNSIGLRFPASLLEAAGLHVGKHVTMRLLDNGDIRVRPIGASVPADNMTAESLASKPMSSASDVDSAW